MKEVPNSLEDISDKWCEMVLHKEGLIDNSTTVKNVVVERLINEDTGAIDGGGLMEAQIIRIKLTYHETNDNFKNPSSIIAKHMATGSNMCKGGLSLRLFVFFAFGKNVDEKLWRTDIKFYRKVVPLLKHTYKFPEIYYTGITDGGDRGFFNEVVRSTPHKVRTISLMQDMKGWKAHTVGINRINVKETIAILQNLAILHGTFWGDRNTEIRNNFDPAFCEREVRGAKYSKWGAKQRKKFLSNPNSVRTAVNQMIKNWEDHEWFRIPQNDAHPPWLRTNIESDENKEYISILKDPIILEMIDAYVERFPSFNPTFSKKFLDMPSQTLLHGDCHNGNHMYLEKNGEIEVIALDFQMVGPGVVVSDIIRLFYLSRRHVSVTEDKELLKKYHEALVSSGVESYSYNDLCEHYTLGCFESLTRCLVDLSSLTPKKMVQMYQDMFGHEKWMGMKRMLESGVSCYIFLFLTSLYQRDKQKFLIDDSFLHLSEAT